MPLNSPNIVIGEIITTCNWNVLFATVEVLDITQQNVVKDIDYSRHHDLQFISEINH